MRGALFRPFVAVLAMALSVPAWAGDSKVVIVEFQPATDDAAGLAYLLYSTVSEALQSSGSDEVVAGEDVEMYLGSAAADCHKKRSCLDKLAERFQASVALLATIERADLEIAVTYAFIATATGNVLDQGKRVYPAGEEGEFSQLILDKAGGAIASASDDEWAAEVDDGEAVPGPDPDESRADDTTREDEGGYSGSGGDGGEEEDRHRYSAREFERSSSQRDEEEREERARAAEAERAQRAREREDRYARTREEEDDQAERDARGDREGRESRYSREGASSDSRDREGRYDRDREERTSGDPQRRSDRDRERDRERVKVRDLGDGGTDAGASSKKEKKEEKKKEERKAASSAAGESGRAGRSTTSPTPRTGRSKKHPEDSEPVDGSPLIDPVLLETFDSDDDARFAEEGRSGTTRLSGEEAAELGIGAAEYRAYTNSGLTYEGWTRKRYDHKGTFHLRFAGFYALGGLDMYYSVRVVRDAAEIYETFYWQTYGFREVSGGGTIGLGFGVASAVDLSVEGSLYFGEQWLLREWRTPDSTESTIGSTVGDPPRGSAMHFMIEPKTRFYFTPFKPVKPYAGFGFALIFMPPFEVPEEWAPDRPGTFVLGLEPAVGVQFDTPLGVGFFLEAPFTWYAGSDHGNETGLDGEGAYLSEDEKEPPPPGPVPGWMLRVQFGVQIRI